MRDLTSESQRGGREEVAGAEEYGRVKEGDLGSVEDRSRAARGRRSRIVARCWWESCDR